MFSAFISSGSQTVFIVFWKQVGWAWWATAKSQYFGGRSRKMTNSRPQFSGLHKQVSGHPGLHSKQDSNNRTGGGQRNGSVVKSACCFFNRMGLSSFHPLGDLQPRVTPVLGDLTLFWPPWALQPHSAHTYIHVGKTMIDIKRNKI